MWNPNIHSHRPLSLSTCHLLGTSLLAFNLGSSLFSLSDELQSHLDLLLQQNVGRSSLVELSRREVDQHACHLGGFAWASHLLYSLVDGVSKQLTLVLLSRSLELVRSEQVHD